MDRNPYEPPIEQLTSHKADWHPLARIAALVILGIGFHLLIGLLHAVLLEALGIGQNTR